MKKCMFKQMPSFLEDKFFEYQCGCRKDFSTKHSLVTLCKKRKNAVDKG